MRPGSGLSSGVWGAEQSARLLGSAQKTQRAACEPPIVTGLAQRVSHTREASVQI